MPEVLMLKLHLFLISGKTFTFNDITEFGENEHYIWFTYKAQSDTCTKSGRFNLGAVAGYSWLK